MDTAFSYVDKDRAFFSSDERKWINKVLKLKEKHPDQVIIKAIPDNNDGCIYVELPTNWLRISPPRKMELSQAERVERANRMKKHVNSSRNETNEEDDET